jgi:tetratricopeptide (TPR) repeat protein
MLKEDFPTCEAVTRYYESRFEQNKNDKTFLEEVINFFASSGCDRPDLYLEASENLYHIAPGPESAHNLAFLFINRNDFEKATSYLEEAVQSESTNAETRAEWYYELAVVSNATKDYCKAIEYAREAIKLKSDYGKAYLLLGDVFVASRFNLGDDFQQRTAFWAAADKYRKASSADPSLAKEASERLADYAGQYPNKEDVFFHDIKNGDSYLVGGCINENTTVRSSN